MRTLTHIKSQLSASNIDAINNTQLNLVKGGTSYPPYACGCGTKKSRKVKSIKVKSIKLGCGTKKSAKKSSGSSYCNPRPNPCLGW